uniref:Putative ribonuclease H-like domain-containing protein n=1 Tax=Tanacetum cinerariifolium TaxID=118510 RepID=A0A6L2J587_TANCI|nr:putative ribonuclease H-like domain-containing protein [Tanacetum cinerariifolium]
MMKSLHQWQELKQFKDFVVYQMDVKSDFLYENIKEEVCVCQPPGFEDPDFSDKVYKVEKALYRLHQASRAWYETLSTYLLDNGFQRGMIDKTLFRKRDKSDIMLVQVYVDDIIFGSTRKEMCTEFEKMTHKKFQMSSMGELTFFLGLQHLDTGNKFLMYPRFVQVFLDKQVDGMSKNNAMYVIPSHTKKVFRNMKIVKKDFSGKETPLFPTMLVPAQEEELGEGVLDDEEVVEKAVAVKEVDAAQDQVSAATTTVAKDLTIDDITQAKSLEALNTLNPKIKRNVVSDYKETSESTTIPTSITDSTRPKAKGIVMQEPSETPTTTTTTIPISSKVQDKRKGDE